MKSNTDQIAAEAAKEALLSLTEIELTSIIKSAIEKARKDDAWTIKDLERQRDNFKAYAVRAAHASEQRVTYNRASEAAVKLYNDLFFGKANVTVQERLDMIDAALPQRPTPVTRVEHRGKHVDIEYFGRQTKEKLVNQRPTPATDDTKRLDWLEANNATVGRLPSPDMGGNNWYLRTPSIASSKMPRKKSPREAIDDAMSQTKEKE